MRLQVKDSPGRQQVKDSPGRLQVRIHEEHHTHHLSFLASSFGPERRNKTGWWFTWDNQLVIDFGQSAGNWVGTFSWWLSWDNQLVTELGQSAGDWVGTVRWRSSWESAGDSVGTVSQWFSWNNRWFSRDSQLVIQLGQSAGDSVGTVSQWFSWDMHSGYPGHSSPALGFQLLCAHL